MSREQDWTAALLSGAAPAFVRCGCGTLTMRSPCWECDAAAREARERRERARMANVPPAFAWAHRGNLALLRERCQPRDVTVDDALEAVLAGRRVLLVGGAGSGKTSLAVAALNDRRSEAMFVTATAIARERMNRALGHGEGPLFERAVSSPILVLDDLGAEGSSAPEREAVGLLIRERFDVDAVTWITSGLSSTEMAARYDAGVVSRIVQRHGCSIVAMSGAQREVDDAEWSIAHDPERGASPSWSLVSLSQRGVPDLGVSACSRLPRLAHMRSA